MTTALDTPARFALLLREAKDYRSRELMRISPQAAPWPMGVPVNAFGNIAAGAAEIVAVTLVPCDARSRSVEGVIVVARDCEISDTHIAYYDHPVIDPPAWNARLAELGIIVRPGVFPPVRRRPLGARLDIPPPGTGSGDGAQLVPAPGAPGLPMRHVFEARLFGIAIGFAWRRRGR